MSTFKNFKSKIIDYTRSETGQAFMNSLLAIGIGLLLGFIIMLITRPASSLQGFGFLLSGGFLLGLQSLGDVFQGAAPIIFTGLAFAFASKTGLFNIGASGQFMVGGIAALYVAELVTLPKGIHFLAALLAAIIAGGIWGAIAGILKAFFNVSEVISTIMLNYIGMYLSIMLAMNKLVYNDKISAVDTYHPTANTPIWGLNKIFTYSTIDISIFLAIIIAIIISFILKKTTLGYQLKAVGYSNSGSKYAGISYKRNVIIAMFIAGSLAGFGAAMTYLASSPTRFEVLTRVAGQGFDGMSVALLAHSNPIGIIFSGIFIAYLKKGAEVMQIAGYNKEIASIVMAAIIYITALSTYLGTLFRKQRQKHILHKNQEREGKMS